jgi:hypothetical protein
MPEQPDWTTLDHYLAGDAFALYRDAHDLGDLRVAELLAPAEVHHEAAALGERLERCLDLLLQLRRFEDVIGWGRAWVELANITGPFVALPISFDRLPLAEVQCSIANSRQEICTLATGPWFPHRAARPQLCKQILDELFSEGGVADVADGEAGQCCVMRSKQPLESPLVHDTPLQDPPQRVRRPLHNAACPRTRLVLLQCHLVRVL